MGKLKQDLFQLIKSLDGNEKGYFKKYSQIHSSESGNSTNIIRLFDAIDAMDVYDEAEIKRKFKGETFLSQLPVTKNYLYASILKSLRSYSSKANLHLQVLSALQDIQLLAGKGLYEKALECIQAAKKKAAENEFFGYLTELTEAERMMTQAIQPMGNYLNVIHQLNSERSDAIEKLSLEQSYINLTHRANAELFFPSKTGKKNKREEIAQELYVRVFDTKSQPKSVYSGHLISNLKMMYFRIREQFAASYPVARKGFELLLQNPFIVQKNPYAFYNKAFHLGIIMEHLKLYKELNALLNRIPEFEKQLNLKLNPKLRGFILQERTNLSIIYFLNSGQLDKGIEFIKAVEKEIKGSEKEFAHTSVYTFYYYSAVFYITTGHFKEAVNYLNQLLVFRSYSILPVVEMVSKYLLVIAHYELGNQKIIPSLDKLFKPEEIMEPMGFLKTRLAGIKNKAEEKAMLIEFKNRLGKSKQQKRLLAFFDFASWAESKIQNKKFILGT